MDEVTYSPRLHLPSVWMFWKCKLQPQRQYNPAFSMAAVIQSIIHNCSYLYHSPWSLLLARWVTVHLEQVARQDNQLSWCKHKNLPTNSSFLWLALCKRSILYSLRNQITRDVSRTWCCIIISDLGVAVKKVMGLYTVDGENIILGGKSSGETNEHAELCWDSLVLVLVFNGIGIGTGHQGNLTDIHVVNARSKKEA